MKTWKRFCLTENENREVSNIPEQELNLLLCKFFKNIKKLDGTEYEPGSLTSFQRSIQRSLNEAGSNVNIIEADSFFLKLSREVLSARHRNQQQRSSEAIKDRKRQSFRINCFDSKLDVSFKLGF